MKKTIKDDTTRKELNFWNKLWSILTKKDKIRLLGILVLQIIGSFFEVVGLGAIPAFILAVANPDKIIEHEIAGPILQRFHIVDSETLLVWGAITLITVFILKNIFILFVHIIRANFLRNLQVKYGMELFQKYMHADYTYLISHNTAELVRNCVIEVSQVVVGILQGILNLLMDIFLVINISIVLFVMEPLITFITISVIGSIAIIFMKVTKKRLDILGKRAQVARKDVVLAVNQGLNGIKETRIMQAENFFIRAYRVALEQMSRSAKFQSIISGTIKPLFETLAVASLLFIALLMYFQNRSLDGVIPLLTMFSVAMIRLLPAIRQITTTISQLRYTFYSINPIYESQFIPIIKIADSVNKSITKGIETDNVTFNNSIEVKNLSYFYPGCNEPAVNCVNFTIKKKEVVAFIGSSGAGKTTLVDVLTGLLTPQQGKILIDGIDIGNNLRQWQKHLGYIPQFIYLADDTLKNNILWGENDTEHNISDLIQAIKSAQLEELINQLPKGVNTIIGERGTRLSGGQRQRIGIARALYRDPDLLVMDEATAALDNITEKEITSAINKMKGHRTMIIIAHRLSTVRNCDKLYLMDKGKIIASGSYDELIANSPEFRALEGSQTEV